jgi:hypothetical protein
MKKFGEILLKILKTIVAVPLGVVGSILLTPFYLIVFIIAFSSAIIEDIWEIN